MAILKVDTISGIGTEGPVFEGDIEFTSQNFLTLPKGDTTQRGRGRGFICLVTMALHLQVTVIE